MRSPLIVAWRNLNTAARNFEAEKLFDRPFWERQYI